MHILPWESMHDSESWMSLLLLVTIAGVSFLPLSMIADVDEYLNDSDEDKKVLMERWGDVGFTFRSLAPFLCGR